MKRWERWLPLVIAAAGVLAYVNSFAAPFVFDDHNIITRNRTISSIGDTQLTSRVLVDLSFRLNYALSGLRAADYRAVNIAFHLLAGLALFGILRRTLRLDGIRESFGSAAPWVAGTAATVWLVHPLHTESVTYICQRYESLMGLLSFLTLYGFVRSATSRTPRRWANVAVTACALGMAAKESMVVVPPLVLAFDVMILGRFSWRGARSRWRTHAGMFATWGILACLYLRTEAYRLMAGMQLAPSVSPVSYLLTQAGVVLRYVRLAVLPYGQCLDYAWPVTESLAEAALPGSVILLLLGLTAWGVVRRKAAAYLGVCFFAALAPTSSVLPLDDMAFEHRMYVPLAAAAAAGVCVCYLVLARVLRAAGRDRAESAAVCGAVAALAVVALGTATAARNCDYRSEETMWRDVVRKRPANLRACNELATCLAETGRPQEARRYYRAVLSSTDGKVRDAVGPDGVTPYAMAANSPAWNRFQALANLGLLSLREGREEEAIGHYVAALRIVPYSELVAAKLAHALRASGVPGERVDAEIRRRVWDFGGDEP